MKCFELLHQISKAPNSQSIQMDFTIECHLNIFQMANYDNEPLCKCVNWKLLLWRFEVDVRNKIPFAMVEQA